MFFYMNFQVPLQPGLGSQALPEISTSVDGQPLFAAFPAISDAPSLCSPMTRKTSNGNCKKFFNSQNPIRKIPYLISNIQSKKLVIKKILLAGYSHTRN